MCLAVPRSRYRLLTLSRRWGGDQESAAPGSPEAVRIAIDGLWNSLFQSMMNHMRYITLDALAQNHRIEGLPQIPRKNKKPSSSKVGVKWVTTHAPSSVFTWDGTLPNARWLKHG